MVGLLHDFDYEKYPSLDDHPYKGNEILKQRGWPELEIRRAIMSHAEYTGVTRDTARWRKRSSPATNSPDSSPRSP
jgi:predicted hydrolase (HD superfamily)